MQPTTIRSQRSRRDRCPGVFRPWPAEDGGLVRLRLIGGRLAGGSLQALSEVAQEYGDGDVHLTGRANLQLRAMPVSDGRPARPRWSTRSRRPDCSPRAATSWSAT